MRVHPDDEYYILVIFQADQTTYTQSTAIPEGKVTYGSAETENSYSSSSAGTEDTYTSKKNHAIFRIANPVVARKRSRRCGRTPTSL